MSYFNFPSSYRDDTRVERLKRSLRLSKPTAVGHLALLFSWASSEDFRAFTGDLSGFTAEKISEASEWASDPVLWVKSLIDAEFLSRDPSAPSISVGEAVGGQLTIVDWIETCGEACKRRIERYQLAKDATNGHASDDPWTILENGVFNTYLNKSNAVWRLFYVYKFIKKEKDKTAVKEDVRWDLLNKDRQLPWCKKILQSYEGDLKKAATAVYEIGEYFENLGCMWDASTVHKRLTDWEEKRLGR